MAVRVTPRAKRNAFAGLIDAGEGRMAVAVRLAAPPVDGAANKALIAFLAAELGLAQSVIRLVSGGKGRLKAIRLPASAAAALEARIAGEA